MASLKEEVANEIGKLTVFPHRSDRSGASDGPVAGTSLQADRARTQIDQRLTSAAGCPVPPALTGMLLDAALAYEEQCSTAGGLTLRQRRELMTMAKSDDNRRGAGGVASRSSKPSARAPKSSGPLPFAIGTEFHREWQGRLHVVMMTADGLLWSGQTFGSLSAVARAITGTRWNGYRFFGVTRHGAVS